jgi:hypothetical protein
VGNPIQAVLQQLMAQRGQPGMQAGAPQGGPGMGSAVSQQMSQLRGADPTMTVRTLEKMEKDIAALISQNIQSVPGVAAALSGVIKSIQRAKKEAQQAQQTMSAMGPPIQFSPAQSGGGPDNNSGPEMG